MHNPSVSSCARFPSWLSCATDSVSGFTLRHGTAWVPLLNVFDQQCSTDEKSLISWRSAARWNRLTIRDGPHTREQAFSSKQCPVAHGQLSTADRGRSAVAPDARQPVLLRMSEGLDRDFRDRTFDELGKCS